MGGLFNYDAPFWRGMGKVADVIILNLLFIVSCIPVITVGAATTALYDAAWKLSNDEGTIWHNYWHSFKLNFKQATAIWLIVALVGAMVWYSFITYVISGIIGNKLMIVVGCIPALIWCVIVAWVFPLQSRFYNKVWVTLRNSLLCGVGYLPRTLGMVALNVLPVVIFLLRADIFLRGSAFLVLFYYAAVAYLNVKLLKKPFNKMIDQVNGVSEDGEEEKEEPEAIEE